MMKYAQFTGCGTEKHTHILGYQFISIHELENRNVHTSSDIRLFAYMLMLHDPENRSILAQYDMS